jgi:hypothetical protein
MADLFIYPARATDSDGNPLSGAKLFFYQTGTTTPASVYVSSTLDQAHANPVVANAAGLFSAIYLDPEVTYRVVAKTSDEGTTMFDLDPVGGPEGGQTFATLDGVETLTNKTLTTPVLSGTASGTTAGRVGYSSGALTYGDGSNQRELVDLSRSQTLTNKTLTTPTFTGTPIEDVYTIADGAAFEIDPANGSIQTITLGANRTPKATNFQNGQSVLMGIDDGSAYTLTWTDATFGGSGVKWLGGTAPTLATSGLTWVALWKVGGQVYGNSPGASS